MKARVPTGRLARNTIYSTFGLVVRAVIQACYLILLSRRMGSHDYGLFAGSVAVAILVAPLSGWGVAYVLAQQVSRDPSRARALWATALVQIGLSGAALILIVMLVSATVLGERIDALSMLMLAIAELVALPAAQVATTLCVVLGRGAAAASVICLVPAGRLMVVTASFFFLGAAPSPSHVAASHFIGSLAGVAAAMAVIARVEGKPAWRNRLSVPRAIGHGSQYAVGSLVGTSYPEIDKVLLLQLAGAAVVGTYTVAFRVMAVLLLPISALVSNALPRLFAAQSGRDRLHILKAVSMAATGYAVVAAIAAFLFAPFAPDIFGPSFTESSRYLELMCVWVILFALHQCAATGLTGSGRQWARIAVEAGGVVAIVVINLIAIPALGGRGSILALLVSEVLMAGGCWALLRDRIRSHDARA
jgi:O-antigen/teichoic acid export membrane protein